MLHNYQKRKLKQSRFFYFSLTLFFVSLVSAGGWNIYKSYASIPSSSLICNTDEVRTISVGTYTDAAGNEFTSASNLDLSAADGPCTFVLTQSESDSSISLQSLEVGSNVTLTHATSTASAATYNKIDLDIVGAVVVNGSIDVSAKGYLGGYQGNNDSGLGQGFGNENTVYEGASHGGRGANANSDVYDSIKFPSLPGAGGQAMTDSPGDEGGNGGGVVIISASGFSGIGTISANGGNSIYGGGAGGTISLDAGGGNISDINILAYGGNTGAYSAGGGGRISLRNYSSITAGVSAPGGLSSGGDEGAAGTIFKRSTVSVYGELFIFNTGVTSATYATNFSSTIDSLDATAEYGNALVFDSVEVSNGAVLNISDALDPVSDGTTNRYRKIYISSCAPDDDDLSNGEIVYNFAFAVAGENADYICVPKERVVSFEQGSTTVSEDQGTGTITVTLEGPTSEEVSFDLTVVSEDSTATAGVDYTTSTETIIIPIGATTSSYTFTIIDDNEIEEQETIKFSMQNAVGVHFVDGNTSHVYQIDDNDSPALLVSESSDVTAIYEPDTSDSFEVRLQALPTDIVTTTLEISDPTRASLSVSSLVFTPENWNIPQTVTITAIDNLDLDILNFISVTITANSNDMGYQLLSPEFFSAYIIDNDQFLITETDDSTILQEEGVTTDTINYRLGYAPSGLVYVNVTTTDQNILFSTTTLYFNTENWDQDQAIIYTVLDDQVNNDRSVAITYDVDSDDGYYDEIHILDTEISVTDTDVDGPAANMVFTSNNDDGDDSDANNLYEPDGTFSYTVELASQPTEDVTINITFPDIDEYITLSTSSLIFTSATWNIPQTVQVSVLDTELLEAAQNVGIYHTASSLDEDYNNLELVVMHLNIIGNNQIVVDESDDSTILQEEGSATDTISYSLAFIPTDPVTLALHSSDENVTFIPNSLSFTSENWNVPQDVLFTVENDDINNDRDVDITYTLESDDLSFNGANISTTTISTTDTDTLDIGITVSSISRHTTEDRRSATFTVVLESQPTDQVLMNLSSSDESEGTISPDTLTFTAVNWDDPQTVTVTGVNDSQDDGDVAYMITFDSVISNDENYNNFELDPVDVINDDNDSAHHGGGGGGTVIIRPTTDSAGNALYALKIENGAEKTNKTKVNLNFVGNEIQSVALSNFENFAGVSYVPFTANMDFDLLPGPGIKTVYAKVQTSKGIIYNISDTIELSAALPDLSLRPNIPVADTANCLLTAQKAYKSADSPRVYMIHKYKNTLSGDRCTKEYLASPLYFFSYFRSWGDVEEIDAKTLNSIPDDAFASPVLGPRFIPYNGSIVRTLENEQAYYIMNGSKYALSGESAFRHMGFDLSWTQIVNTEVFNGFKDADTLTSTSPWPVGLVIHFTSIPSRVYQVIETTKDNKVRVKDLGLLEKMDDKFYRRDRVVHLERNINVLLPSFINIPKVTLTRFLKLGSSGPDVKYLQAKLQSLGYFTYESATGRYGYETVRAVERFQKDHNIEVKGYVGPATRDLINSL